MKNEKCRACGSDQMRLVYDFGPQPLAGKFPLVPEAKELAQRFPLDLTQCDACGLLQVTYLPPIDTIFHDDYRYSTSTVPALVEHFSDYAAWLDERLPRGATILEFGCNDGVLLSKLRDKGFSCVGIDASDNVAELARAQCLRVHTGFLTEDLVHDKHLENKCDLVTCSNVFAHIDDVRATLSAVWSALKTNGIFIIEVHDANALVRDKQFETIYHEHLSFFTEMTLRRLVESEGFAFVGCTRTPMHGGSLRFVCQRQERDLATSAPALSNAELVDGSEFAAIITRCAEDVRAAKKQYGLLDGYGAAGRAQMFVNMTDSADCFEQVFDDSPLRQDRYIVGTNIPIRKYGLPRGRACIILAWSYAAPIAERIRDHYEKVLTVLPQRTVW